MLCSNATQNIAFAKIHSNYHKIISFKWSRQINSNFVYRQNKSRNHFTTFSVTKCEMKSEKWSKISNDLVLLQLTMINAFDWITFRRNNYKFFYANSAYRRIIIFICIWKTKQNCHRSIYCKEEYLIDWSLYFKIKLPVVRKKNYLAIL